MAKTNDMNTPTKVPCGGFVLGEGLTLGEDGKTLNVSGGGSQADWNQNDESAADYVKNRPGGYEAYVPTIVASGQFSNGVQQKIKSYYYLILSPTNPLVDVKIDDGSTRTYSATRSESQGNIYWKVGDEEFTEIDFYLILLHTPVDGDFVTFKFKDQQSHNCVVSPYILGNVLIDQKWLPNGNVKDLFSEQGYETSGATIGDNNIGEGGLIVGYNCNLRTGLAQPMLGVGEFLVESRSYGYLVIGCYNADSKTFSCSDSLLVVGNGTSDTARHNAFMVTKTGEIVVPSSTKDSSKYFAITVDDTGTIKATEVTAN